MLLHAVIRVLWIAYMAEVMSIIEMRNFQECEVSTYILPVFIRPERQLQPVYTEPLWHPEPLSGEQPK